MIHGTVNSLKKDLIDSGWVLVSKPKIGDVLIWQAKKFDNRLQEHAGFYIGDNKAISMSQVKKTPVIHDINFGEEKRKVIKIYRLNDWEYLY